MGNFINIKKQFDLQKEQKRQQQQLQEQLQEQFKEQLQEQRLKDQQLKDQISMEIDLYIRKKKDFDSKYPLKYKCSANLIDISGYFQKKLYLIKEYNYNFSFIFFLKEQERFIINPINQISLKYLTPFQGKLNHRVYGYFKCNKCNKSWKSGESWANKWQKCKNCDDMIYPYEQHPLEKQFEDSIHTYL